MYLHPGTEHNLTLYSVWVEGIWDRNVEGLDDRDYTIMSLGLGGEVGEFMSVIETSDTAFDRKLAIKELGDVMYYWAMICRAFEVDPTETWKSVLPSEQFLDQRVDEAARQLVEMTDRSRSLPMLGVVLSARTGDVLEQLKKLWRDGVFDKARFSHSMGRVAQAWCAVVQHLNIVPSDILRANIDKVEDRFSRGVMCGSGDDR